MITIRQAGIADTREMAQLLTAIIHKGGTTALVTPVNGADIANWMAQDPDQSAWHVAVDETGGIAGFQWIGPHPKLPPQACDVATFVRIGKNGLGIGSALFEATKRAARACGFAWINATIRADNDGDLAFVDFNRAVF